MLMKVVSPRGKYKDDGIYYDIVGYVTRRDKCRSGFVITRNLGWESIADDMVALDEKFGKKKGTRIRHMIISFEERDRATPEIAVEIAEKACDFYAGEYQVLAAVHEDTENLHFHMVMHMTSIRDGKKYTGRRKDYYDFQKWMKAVGRRYGMRFEVMKSE